ncbi:MAG TPA: FkbM family methyltransferase [Isosphaeraceae bacterium]|jgi:FkbM family methyltransferase|nr:FkbM family methyltransferase [Isosphaeraceae bacterium]
MKTLKPVQVPEAREIARVSYAQNMEDILLDRVFRGRTGTYMDIGANHPFLESNTYFFYLRGWRGVNVEPIPAQHALFDEHRPGDLNLNVAASDADGELTFFEIADADGLTGHSTFSAEVAGRHRALGFAVAEYPVPVRTVAALVAEHAIEPPDFLSIDVECHEEAVLRGIPWDSWRPGVLVVESLLPLSHAASHAAWEPDVLGHGYRFAATNGVNRFFLRDDLADRLDRLATPVNVLDHFEAARVVDLRRQVDQLGCDVQYLKQEYEKLSTDREWDRANFERIRAGWDWGRSQAEEAKAAWARQCDEFERHRANFERALEDHRRERSYFEAQQAAHHQARSELAARVAGLEAALDEARRHCIEVDLERAHNARVLAETQTELRPYRLLDRLGVVRAGYAAARRVRRRLVS